MLNISSQAQYHLVKASDPENPLNMHSRLPSESSHNGSCCTILAAATAVPPHTITRDDMWACLARVFNITGHRLESMKSVVGNARVRKRHLVFPVEYTITPRSLQKTNQEYQEHTIALGRAAVEDCLAKAGLAPADIDMFITISCTGFMIPSVDAHLIASMGFRPDVRRLPITELGCAAGAMSLARAWEFLRAFPERNVLILSVELPSLTFQRRDVSPANLISSVLFGDGAAAAIVSGKHAGGPHILDAETYTFPDSLDAMGFDLRDSGFHIVLSKDVPMMIRQKIKGLIDRFLARNNLHVGQIGAFVLHPGGQKLLSYIEDELGLTEADTRFSWDVLGEYGNLSSATILFILKEWLESNKMAPGSYGLAVAFGPGFSAELLLLQWA